MSIEKDVKQARKKKLSKKQIEMINELKNMGLLEIPENKLANNLDYIDIPTPYIGTNAYSYQH